MKSPSKFKTVITKILLFILVWLASMLVIGIVGACIYQGSKMPLFFTFMILLVPVALAILVVMPRKKAQPASHSPTTQIMPVHQPVSRITSAGDPSKSMHCTACGAVLTVSGVYCTHCGAKVCVIPIANSEPSLIREDKSIPEAKTYRVTGLEHYRDNILSLALENDDYTKTKRELIDDLMTEERIWKYNFYPSKVELIPEPDNLYDPNAIKVIVDSEHVGYIKKGSCKHLLNVIAEGRLGDIDCTIGGGPYKYIYEDYDDNGNEKYEMERDEINLSVVLYIVEREV